jgi:hypothetical protein
MQEVNDRETLVADLVNLLIEAESKKSGVE